MPPNPNDPRSTAQSFISNDPNMMTTGAIGGERVRVAMRLRPEKYLWNFPLIKFV